MRTNVIIMFFVLICTTASKKLPDNFKICDHFAPDLNDCLKVAITSAMQQLGNGLPEIDAPPISPLEIPSAKVERGEHSLTFNNIKIYNLTNGIVENVNATVTRKSFLAELDFSSKELSAKGDYNLKINILSLSIDGSGEGVIIFRDSVIKLTIEGKAVEINGKMRYQLYNFTIRIQPKLISFHFEDIIKGNKELSNEINKSFNDNWEVLYEMVEDDLEQIIDSYFTPYANNILKYVPI